MPTKAAMILAALAPLGLSLVLGGHYIRFLQTRYMGQYIREDGPESHQSKAGTPTAGGVLILVAVLFAALCLFLAKGIAFFTVPVLCVLGITLLFGGLGFVDDYLKISKKKNKGVSGYTKLLVQIVAGALIGWLALQTNPAGTVSFFNWFSVDLGWVYPLFSAFVVTGASNAVNLTDGLDGLASGTALMTFMTFSLMLLASAGVPSHPELALLAQAFAGAVLGFLFFNRHPARVFMGDTGSLALGGAMGAMAIVGHLELWLFFLAAIYILETLSVILQVWSFKTTGKRIFRMSPLHHHFELGGWSETRVVYSFVTVQFVCCALAVFLYNKG
jgi:phospho-N-acetylmuramoyl-pentapeptide-transferase